MHTSTPKALVSFAVLSVASLLLPKAHAVIALPIPRDTLDAAEVQVGVAGSYLDTKNNFDGGGSDTRLPQNGAFRSMKGTLFLGSGITDNLSFFGNFQGVSQRVKSGPFEAETSGPGDAEAGFRYSPVQSPIRMQLELGVLFPMYKRLAPAEWAQLNSQSNPPLGNGITEYSVSGTAEIPLARDLNFGLGVGHILRSSGFSNLLPYTAYLKYHAKRGHFFKVALEGIPSINNDSFTGQNAADRSRNVIGGSNVLNATNPSAILADASFGSYIGKTVFMAVGARYELAGKNVPHSPLFTAAIGLDFGGKNTDSGYSKSNRGFQEYYFQGTVVQVNKSLRQCLMNKGKNDGVKMGELLDLFEPDSSGQTLGEAVARMKVIEVGPTRSKLELLEHFRNTGDGEEEDMAANLKEGFVVRRPVR